MASRKFMRPVSLGIVLVLVLCTLPLAADDPIAQADELYKKRIDLDNIHKAIAILNPVLEKEPANYDALWRIARCHWFLGDKVKGKEKLNLFIKGRDYAERATKANDNGLEGHYWYGSLIGCVGQERGILNSLFMVKPMKAELEKALAIDPKHADSHDVMAQLLWKVPGFAGGSKKKAQEEARLATLYGPEATEHWLHYGQIAADNRDYKTARMAFEKTLSLPDDPEDPVASQKDKEEARKGLKEIEGKK
ncbi:MAG: tetratricopeptide repeat protein [Patescibacteria group bacterium]